MDRFQNTRQPDWGWWGRLWPTPGETLRTLGVGSGNTLAEIGCGNGYFALPAARITNPGTVYAADIDPSLLEELADLATKHGIENISPVECDARHLPQHLPKPVDTMLIANTFHGIDDPAAFLTQAGESLKPGGRCIIINWEDKPQTETRINGDPRGPPTDLRLSPTETEQLATDHTQLTHEETIGLPPYHYASIFGR